MHGMKGSKAVLENRDKGWSKRKTAEKNDCSRSFARKGWKADMAEIEVQKRKYQHALDT